MKKTWCIGRIDARFIAQMEHLLALYRLPYDPSHPVICFDERPCFLIGDTVMPIPMKAGDGRSPGWPQRMHYEYEKHGSCALLMAIEPLTGKRLAMVFKQRRKCEYAQFMKQLAARYPEAQKIHLVQDNLNTHHAGSFYEQFLAEEAFALQERFAFHYTPKKASWLNMVEIELSAISRQCLNRRISSQQELACEVVALVKEREQKQIKINWQFSIETARTKLNRHYRAVHIENSMYQ